MIEVASEVEVIKFGWDFEYEVACDVKDLISWLLILHVKDEEWKDIRIPEDREWPVEVKRICLCLDEVFDV